MRRASKRTGAFVAVVIFVLVMIVMYMGQRNETMRIRMPQREARNDLVLPTAGVKTNRTMAQTRFEASVVATNELKTNRTRTRLNVIILTHFSSGSTVVGNMFNLHPDVFYIYEPLNGLRREIDTNEWHDLPKSTNDAFRNDSSTLLRDLFTCGFHEKRTIELVFPEWAKPYNAWYNPSAPFTKETLREACKARKITVTKIMQTRIGIHELEQVCRSDPGTFDCLIIHLVRDPRAVLSSLIPRGFFMDRAATNLFNQKPMSPEGIKLLKGNVQKLCSLLVENLNHVNTEWSNWFKSRYILVRYEDAISNLLEAASDIYKFVGLPMVDIVTNWIKGTPPPGRKTMRYFGMVLSNKDADTIDKWRFREKSSLVSLFEEPCKPLMKTMGYILVNGSENLQHNKSMPLRTVKIPFLSGPTR